MIQWTLIARTLGHLLMAYAVSLLLPFLVSVLYADGLYARFLGLSIGLFGVGFLMSRRKVRHEPRTREGIVIVVLAWTSLSIVGALPFWFGLPCSFLDAVFESTSGLTTTGATVFSGLDNMAKSLLWYRQQLHFFGGMGVLVLAVAILPMLKVGGMQLYKTEATGPIKDDKIAPRVQQTARTLFSVYVSIIVFVAVLYFLAGMNAFDAISHAISAISTGGFANYDASIGYFDSRAIDWITILAMLAGGMNMGLHFIVWREKSFARYWADQEFRALIFFVLLATTLVIMAGMSIQAELGFINWLRLALFEVVSIMTTTGFGIADFSQWPLYAPILIIFVSFIGGCAGSTSGGMKVLRVFLLFKQASREAKHLVQPNIVAHIKYNGRLVPDGVASGIWGFFALYVFATGILTLLMIGAGLNPTVAFSAVAAMINNMGPGLGEVSSTFASVSPFGKSVAIAAMLFGRLEIMTIFVLFTPIFWRRF